MFAVNNDSSVNNRIYFLCELWNQPQQCDIQQKMCV
jgi:hypothetical protein